MADECKDCGPFESFPHYRVVQTVYERNMILCTERISGMMVTVVGDDRSYKQYMLKGADPCVNSNWVEVNSEKALWNSIGHDTIYSEPTDVISSQYLNSVYPKAKEGFRVTIVPLNSTFMKIAQSNWAITNSIIELPND